MLKKLYFKYNSLNCVHFEYNWIFCFQYFLLLDIFYQTDSFTQFFEFSYVFSSFFKILFGVSLLEIVSKYILAVLLCSVVVWL